MGWRWLRPHRDEWWDWLAVALFLLIPVDLLTTLFATAEYSVAAEANPVMQWILAQHIVVIVAIHLGAVILSVVIFYGIDQLIDSTPDAYQDLFALGIELWLGILIVLGLAVFANNVSVIILGEPLLDPDSLPIL